MNFNRLNRKTHYWATAFVALPMLVIICSGLLLQVKKQSSWVQPKEQMGTGTAPRIDLDTIREATGADEWADIDRIDVRPGKGVAKVRMHTGWEVQVDLGTGEVLQTAYRRSDLIESLHDGSFFGGDLVKLGLFLPVGVVLLAMWVSGIWMFLAPYSARRRRRRRERADGSRGRTGPRHPVKLPPAGGSRNLP